MRQARMAHLERMEAQRRAKLQADLEQSSQGPKMNRNSRRLTNRHGSMDERFRMYQKHKDANLEQARQEQSRLEKEALTFHPQITSPHKQWSGH